jgi:hypothetical protein
MAAGVRRISIHTIRHTFASHFMMRGGSLYDLMAILGHSNLKTTQRYAHLGRTHLESKASIVSFQIPTDDRKIIELSSARNHNATIEKQNAEGSEIILSGNGF